MVDHVYLLPVAANEQSGCGDTKREAATLPISAPMQSKAPGDADFCDIWVGRARIFSRSGVFYCHDNSPAALTPAELSLLKVFYDRPGQILDRDQLSELSLGRKWQPWNRCVDNHVSHLRRKIAASEIDTGLIRTIRGKGYVYLP